MQRQPSAARNYLAHNASSVEVEHLCSKARILGKKEKGWLGRILEKMVLEFGPHEFELE